MRPAASRTPAPDCHVECLAMKLVGELDAGNRHVQFDERGRETECWPSAPSHRARPRLYLLYGPAARCKPKVTIWRSWVLRFCIRPLTERLSSWPSWISARARSHSRLGPEGHMGHLITNALARPFLHLLIPTRRPRESQLWLWDQLKPPPRSHRRSLARSGERRGRQG